MVFENGVKNIQAAAYNGACTVHNFCKVCHFRSYPSPDEVETSLDGDPVGPIVEPDRMPPSFM